MSTAVNIARIAALLAAVTVGVFAARLLAALESEARARESVTRQLPAILHAEADLIRRDLSWQITALRGDIRAEVSDTRSALFGRADGLQALIDTHAARIEAEAVAEIRQTRRELLAEARPAVAGAVDLMAAYQAVPGVVGGRIDRWTQCTGNGNCWQSQITATLGATRATMGAVAKAAPGIAASMDRSADATARATSATADAMRNIAEVSRPLPRWVRVPLQILGPTTPMWLPFTVR